MIDAVGALSVPFTNFELPIEIITIGAVTGLTYALLGIGLTLTYKSSRVLNFAFGEVGAFSAILVPLLVINSEVSYWFALPFALVVATGLGALIEFSVIRRLESASRLIVMIVTIGVAQVLLALFNYLPKVRGVGAVTYPTPFDLSFTVGIFRLNAGHLLILFVVPALVVGLVAFLRWTKVGLGSRAAAENLEAARLVGMPTTRVSLIIWAISGLLAGLAAVLLGPTRPIATVSYFGQAALGPALMLRALAAAMIGGLSSLPRAAVGGLAIGVAEALILWNYPQGGIVELVLFVAIVGSLLLQKRIRQQARGSEESSWSLTGNLSRLAPEVARLRSVQWIRRGIPALLLVLAALAPLMMGSGGRVRMSTVVIFAMMGLSLTVLTGFAGLVSLGQFAFVGLGALVAGRLIQMGYPHWMGLLYAALAGGLAALVVGIPALRIRGLYLAVTTLAFAVLSSNWLFHQSWLVHRGATETSLSVPRFEVLGIDFQNELTYYWLCLGALLAFMYMVARLRDSGAGRMLRAIRDNENYAAALTVPPRRVKLVAFVISGMMAGTAGFFYGGLLVNFPDLTIFGPEQSLVLVTMAVIGNVTTIAGVIQGAIFVKGVPAVLDPILGDLVGARMQLLLAGLGGVVILLRYPGGLIQWTLEIRDWLIGRVAPGVGEDEEEEPDERMTATFPERPEDAPTVRLDLEAEDIVVEFGGITAVDHVSMRAEPGEIVGLLGPNGAGKTTLFDVLSGQIRPTSGTVRLGGHDVTALRPEQRAQLGLGRSFQEARLFAGMSVKEVFKVALERGERSEFVPAMFGAPPSLQAEGRKEHTAGELLELLGLEEYQNRLVGELSTGMRRITELGCLVGLGASVLLLDEPTAGIAQREAEAFGPILLRLREHLDATMILIDHDVQMVLGAVDRAYVLAAGEVIASGVPQAVEGDPEVVRAFLGTDERVIQRSGTLAQA